jgi:hypothetical protein
VVDIAAHCTVSNCSTVGRWIIDKQLGVGHENLYDGIARRCRKSAAVVEWDSLDDAVAFYKSKAWADLAAQRDKATKVIRRYVVETEK